MHRFNFCMSTFLGLILYSKCTDNNCIYAHSVNELREVGRCIKGNQCRFAHSINDINTKLVKFYGSKVDIDVDEEIVQGKIHSKNISNINNSCINILNKSKSQMMNKIKGYENEEIEKNEFINIQNMKNNNSNKKDIYNFQMHVNNININDNEYTSSVNIPNDILIKHKNNNNDDIINRANLVLHKNITGGDIYHNNNCKLNICKIYNNNNNAGNEKNEENILNISHVKKNTKLCSLNIKNEPIQQVNDFLLYNNNILEYKKEQKNYFISPQNIINNEYDGCNFNDMLNNNCKSLNVHKSICLDKSNMNIDEEYFDMKEKTMENEELINNSYVKNKDNMNKINNMETRLRKNIIIQPKKKKDLTYVNTINSDNNMKHMYDMKCPKINVSNMVRFNVENELRKIQDCNKRRPQLSSLENIITERGYLCKQNDDKKNMFITILENENKNTDDYRVNDDSNTCVINFVECINKENQNVITEKGKTNTRGDDNSKGNNNDEIINNNTTTTKNNDNNNDNNNNNNDNNNNNNNNNNFMHSNDYIYCNNVVKNVTHLNTNDSFVYSKEEYNISSDEDNLMNQQNVNKKKNINNEKEFSNEFNINYGSHSKVQQDIYNINCVNQTNGVNNIKHTNNIYSDHGYNIEFIKNNDKQYYDENNRNSSNLVQMINKQKEKDRGDEESNRDINLKENNNDDGNLIIYYDDDGDQCYDNNECTTNLHDESIKEKNLSDVPFEKINENLNYKNHNDDMMNPLNFCNKKTDNGFEYIENLYFQKINDYTTNGITKDMKNNKKRNTNKLFTCKELFPKNKEYFILNKNESKHLVGYNISNDDNKIKVNMYPYKDTKLNALHNYICVISPKNDNNNINCGEKICNHNNMLLNNSKTSNNNEGCPFSYMNIKSLSTHNDNRNYDKNINPEDLSNLTDVKEPLQHALWMNNNANTNININSNHNPNHNSNNNNYYYHSFYNNDHVDYNYNINNVNKFDNFKTYNMYPNENNPIEVESNSEMILVHTNNNDSTNVFNQALIKNKKNENVVQVDAHQMVLNNVTELADNVSRDMCRGEIIQDETTYQEDNKK
ncbi:hypothetical protein PFMALIP_02882, partial [Plasmodium falciparum MaliPS096_E11]